MGEVKVSTCPKADCLKGNVRDTFEMGWDMYGFSCACRYHLYKSDQQCVSLTSEDIKPHIVMNNILK